MILQNLRHQWRASWTDERIDHALAASLLPLLLASVALNQPRPWPVLAALGQLVSIGGTAVAVAIVARAVSNRFWPTALIGALLLARGGRLLAGDPAWLTLAYTAVAAVLFSAAGAFVLTSRPGLLRRQFGFLCAVSAPLMVLQILGVEWSQVLRTDIETNANRGLYPTLFVPREEIVLTGLQARPAGLIYANNVFSIIVLLGLGIYFGRVERRRISPMDVGVLAVVVLLMAKITLLGIAVLFALRMFWGRDARAHTLACIAALAVLLGVYRVVFPGLFVLNLSPEVWIVNFQTRLADLLLATKIPALAAIAERFPQAVLTRLNVSGATQSGYAVLVERGRTLLPTLIVSIPYFWMATRALFQFDQVTRREIVAIGAMACLAPLISPYFGSLLFWFLIGGALRPLWRLVNSGILDTAPRREGAVLS